MSTTKEDLKAELDKTVAALQTLRDEARVKVRLAGMDAKDRWNKLEPEIEKAERAAKEAGDAAHQAATKGLHSLKDFLKSL
jgi:hypothetical protein